MLYCAWCAAVRTSLVARALSRTGASWRRWRLDANNEGGEAALHVAFMSTQVQAAGFWRSVMQVIVELQAAAAVGLGPVAAAGTDSGTFQIAVAIWRSLGRYPRLLDYMVRT